MECTHPGCQLNLTSSWKNTGLSCQTGNRKHPQTGESRVNLIIKTLFLKKIFKNLNFNLHILGFPSILIVEKE